MKNKYFGDINDYHKYGLLRILSNQGKIGTAVCWMLTSDDGGCRRGIPAYLQGGDRYRCLDPELFDALARCLRMPGARSVRSAGRQGILPFARPFARRLRQDAEYRRDYFLKFLTRARTFQLVFFDPDTGLKWMWSPRGGKTSRAHLYLDELQMTVDAGHSVLVYQQFPRFPREPRNQFVGDLASGLCQLCRTPVVFSFRTSRVVFLLVPQWHLIDYFDRRSREVERHWRGRIGVARHRARPTVLRNCATVHLDSGVQKALQLKAAKTRQPVPELVNKALRQSLAEDAMDLAAFQARTKEPNLPFERAVKDSGRRGEL